MNSRVYGLNVSKDILPPQVKGHDCNTFTIINPQKLPDKWASLKLSANQYTLVKKFIWFDSHKLIPHMIVASPNTNFVSCTYQPKV